MDHKLWYKIIHKKPGITSLKISLLRYFQGNSVLNTVNLKDHKLNGKSYFRPTENIYSV
jgi:hypothetical protein